MCGSGVPIGMLPTTIQSLPPKTRRVLIQARRACCVVAHFLATMWIASGVRSVSIARPTIGTATGVSALPGLWLDKLLLHKS
jgi:hypothetical protein